MRRKKDPPDPVCENDRLAFWHEHFPEITTGTRTRIGKLEKRVKALEQELKTLKG
jgi:hypothetical protein